MRPGLIRRLMPTPLPLQTSPVGPRKSPRPRRSALPGVERIEGRTLLSATPAGPLSSILAPRTETGEMPPSRFDRARASEAPGPTTFRNLPYFSDAGGSHLLDVSLPTGAAPPGGWPVVVVIHGGGWRKLGKESVWSDVQTLTTLGYAVVAPDYTLSKPGVSSWPDALQDVRGSVRWVRANAARFGLDPDRVAAMGASAGGHLAAMVGLTPDPAPAGDYSASVDAVIDLYGPTDLASLYYAAPDNAGGIVRQFLGSSPAQDPAEYRDASPVTYASADAPPFLILHGNADVVVPLDQSAELASRLTAAGATVQFIVVSRGPHGFGITKKGTDLLQQTLRFLGTALAPDGATA